MLSTIDNTVQPFEIVLSTEDNTTTNLSCLSSRESNVRTHKGGYSNSRRLRIGVLQSLNVIAKIPLNKCFQSVNLFQSTQIIQKSSEGVL